MNGAGTALVLVLILLVTCVYQACALLYLHHENRRRMDFWDMARRVGPAAFYLSIALACVLLIFRKGPEWRLPFVVITALVVAAGTTRDVIRKRKRNRL